VEAPGSAVDPSGAVVLLGSVGFLLEERVRAGYVAERGGCEHRDHGAPPNGVEERDQAKALIGWYSVDWC
jgi:hypothetical protein